MEKEIKTLAAAEAPKERKKMIHIHSSVPGKVPTPEQLNYGELGVNYADGTEKVYLKNTSDKVVGFVNDNEMPFVKGNTERSAIMPFNNMIDATFSLHVTKVNQLEKGLTSFETDSKFFPYSYTYTPNANNPDAYDIKITLNDNFLPLSRQNAFYELNGYKCKLMRISKNMLSQFVFTSTFELQFLDSVPDIKIGDNLSIKLYKSNFFNNGLNFSGYTTTKFHSANRSTFGEFRDNSLSYYFDKSSGNDDYREIISKNNDTYTFEKGDINIEQNYVSIDRIIFNNGGHNPSIGYFNSDLSETISKGCGLANFDIFNPSNQSNSVITSDSRMPYPVRISIDDKDYLVTGAEIPSQSGLYKPKIFLKEKIEFKEGKHIVYVNTLIPGYNRCFDETSYSKGIFSTSFGKNSTTEGIGTLTYGSGSHAEGLGNGIFYGTQFSKIRFPLYFTFLKPTDEEIIDVKNKLYEKYNMSFNEEFIKNSCIHIREYGKSDFYGTISFDGEQFYKIDKDIFDDYDHYIITDRYIKPDIFLNYTSLFFYSYGALGAFSHSEGAFNLSSGDASHSEGIMNVSYGMYSHSEGDRTKAIGEASHAEGIETVTNNSGEHAQGIHNISIKSDDDHIATLFSIGNGIDEGNNSTYSNCFEVKRDGTTYINNIGGFTGTNYDAQSLQQVITALNTSLTEATAKITELEGRLAKLEAPIINAGTLAENEVTIDPE